MCGICGVVQVDGAPRPVIAPEALDAMTDVMTHRGPDDRGTHRADGIALGVRRLSIVDVAGGHQPFANETGDVLAIQNGELYDQARLRQELRADGHVLRTRCDTEVLPHLYERHGPAFAERLRGDYGLAVWDARRRRAVLARDRAGVKPLYHARSGELLVFASELKSLLASGLVAPELDEEAVEIHLTLGYVPGPRTLLRGVERLPPGGRLVVADGRVRVDRYWRPPEHAPAGARRPGDERAHAERLLHELDEAVALRLMSDVPLGAMLSGGLDSSLVVALMARRSSAPVKTFAIGFAEDGRGNELAAARSVAQALGTDHHELELSMRDHAVDLGELVWHLDEPVADLSALGFLALSELAARSVTVALSGQGADELLGGYRKHRAAALVGGWRRIPGPARRAGEGLLASSPVRDVRAVRTLVAPGPAERQLAMSGHLDAELRRRLLAPGLLAFDGGATARAIRGDGAEVADDPLPATLHGDTRLALVDVLLHYFDRASMAHSLEVRVPYLDDRVIACCARIPSDLKVRRGETKRVLRLAARGLVPDAVLDRPKVGFFRHAVADWFRAQAATTMADRLLDGTPRYAELLDRRVVAELVAEAAAGRGRRHAQLLLAILMLEVWLAEYLPRAAAPPGRARAAPPAPTADAARRCR